MSFGTLALIVAVGLVGPALASLPRLGPPLVVGEILAGIAVGRSGLNLIDVDDPTLLALSALGFALLMLIVGTHLPIRRPELRPAAGRAIGIAATSGVMAVALGFLLDPLTGLHRPWLLAVLLATSSAAVALPVLQSLGDADGAMLVATAWIAIADVATVLAIPIVLPQGRLTSALIGIGLVFAAAAAVFLLARRLRDTAGARAVRARSREQHWALDLRISLLVLLVLAWIATRYNTSVLIAGFAAGVLLAMLGEPRRLGEQLIGLGEGLLIPLFFVVLGARIDLSALVEQPRNLGLAAIVGGGALAVHVGAALVFRLPVAAGMLATAQLGVPAAVTDIGLLTGVLTPGQAAAIIAGSVLCLGFCAAGAARLGQPHAIGDHTAPAAAAATR